MIYSTGLIPDDPQVYQQIPPVPRFRAFYPPAFDISSDLPKAGNQGAQGSCAAWAIGYAARTYYVKRSEQVDPNVPDNILSPAYVYNTLRKIRGDCSEGTAMSDALDLLKSQGGVPMSVMPYTPKSCFELAPPETIKVHGARFKIEGYSRVDGIAQDEIKGLIFQGHPVIFAIKTPAVIHRYKKDSPPIDETSGEGGHALVMVGYDDNKQAFKFLNSWGERWGDNGYGWITYRSLAALWYGGYVMKTSVNRPTPPPPPAPAPIPVPTPLARPSIDFAGRCGKVEIQSEQKDTGFLVRLSGYVDKSTDIENLVTQLRSQKSVASADVSRLQIRPWPQCEVLSTLQTAIDKGSDLRLKLIPEKSVLRKGDYFQIEVVGPNYPSFLYLAYVQADGSAVQLMRPESDAPVPRNSAFTVGGMGAKQRFRISKPFGHETLVLIATKKILPSDKWAQVKDDRALMTHYRALMANLQEYEPAAAVVFLRTQDAVD